MHLFPEPQAEWNPPFGGACAIFRMLNDHRNGALKCTLPSIQGVGCILMHLLPEP